MSYEACSLLFLDIFLNNFIKVSHIFYSFNFLIIIDALFSLLYAYEWTELYVYT